MPLFKKINFIKLYTSFLLLIVLGRLIAQVDYTFFSYLGDSFFQIYSHVNKLDLLTSVAMLALIPCFVSNANQRPLNEHIALNVSIALVVAGVTSVFSWVFIYALLILGVTGSLAEYQPFVFYTIILIPLKFLLTSLSISLFVLKESSFVMTIQLLELVVNAALNWLLTVVFSFGVDGIYWSTLLVYLMSLGAFYFKISQKIGPLVFKSVSVREILNSKIKSLLDIGDEFIRLASIYASLFIIYTLGENFLDDIAWKELAISFEVIFICSFVSVASVRVSNIYTASFAGLSAKLTALYTVKYQVLAMVLFAMLTVLFLCSQFADFTCLFFNYCQFSPFIEEFFILFPWFFIVNVAASLAIGVLHSCQKIGQFCQYHLLLTWCFYIPILAYKMIKLSLEGFWVYMLAYELLQLVALLMILLKLYKQQSDLQRQPLVTN